MLSISSSCFSSSSFLADSTMPAADAGSATLSTTLLSFSRNLTAYHLFLSAEMLSGRTSATAATAFSRSSEKISFGRSASFLWATSTALSISLSRPVCFKAEVSTTGQFINMERRATSIFMPLFSRRSVMFSAITTGTPVSMS